MKANLTITCAALVGLALPVQAQTDTSESWTFMQEAMPGVPRDLLEAACAEGAVMIYNGTWSEAQQNQIKAFAKRFPCIRVENFELPTGERRERFVAETKAGRHLVDIVQDTDPGVLDEQVEQGLLAEYEVSSDASFADNMKHKGYWYPLRVALAANAWNVDNVTDEEIELLSRWEGITDPRFKGRVGIAMSPTGGGGVTLYPYFALYKTYGEEFMKAFAAQEPRNFSGANTLAGALASGDIDVALAVSETGIIPLQASGAPIEWSLPEPAMGLVTGQGIAAQAPHPNAARLYQEYAFSDEGYAAWNVYGGAPAKTGFADTREVAQEAWYRYPTTFSDVDPRSMNAEKAAFLALNNAWFALQ